MFRSVRFQKIFLIRALGYFCIQAGIIIIILILEPVIVEESRFRLRELVGRHQVLPKVITSADQVPEESTTLAKPAGSRFGDLLLGGSEVITPVSTDFGIVVEKIGANAKVVPNVDPGDEKSYTKALAQGVAHAKGTSYPGQRGNIYLFSHSVDAPWNIVRYNAVFYLLNKMEVGDRVIMFYQGRRYDYLVFDKAIAKPDDTHFLTDSYDQSVLTLQTCDPPGTLFNRLIVRAKLAGN